MLKRIIPYLQEQVSIWPLVTLRVAFGLLMAFAGIRFWYYGWIDSVYIQPEFHFSWFGMDFIQALPGNGMYWVFALMILAALGIAFGFIYRLSASVYFILFTYVELIDKATYLNHYYFVSLIAFLLIFLPAHRNLSVDSWLRGGRLETVPRMFPLAIIAQVSIVYFFAGVAKLNSDWLLEAQPLQIWLPARAEMPLIGWLFQYKATAYAFSWFGAIYDLSIPFFLLWRRTRPFAYLAVVVFHVLTWTLFQIGIFPWVMIFMTLIFFEEDLHKRLWSPLQRSSEFTSARLHLNKAAQKALLAVFAVFFVIQVVTPLRSHWISQDLFWDESGYRFSWRVMLMEKSGSIQFKVIDNETGKRALVDPSQWLTHLQETQMSTQPDMILQFAHFIEDRFAEQGLEDVSIYAESYVTLNGYGSERFIDPTVDLSTITHAIPRNEWLISSSRK